MHPPLIVIAKYFVHSVLRMQLVFIPIQFQPKQKRRIIMIVGYQFLCKGLKEPMSVKGDSYGECLLKFKDYWSNDYNIDTDEMLSVNSINIDFDIV